LQIQGTFQLLLFDTTSVINDAGCSSNPQLKNPLTIRALLFRLRNRFSINLYPSLAWLQMLFDCQSLPAPCFVPAFPSVQDLPLDKVHWQPRVKQIRFAILDWVFDPILKHQLLIIN